MDGEERIMMGRLGKENSAKAFIYIHFFLLMKEK